MAAELIIKNGIVFGSDNTAVAIDGNKIVKVGRDKDICEYITEQTEVIDAAGNTILPGFTDSHMHPSVQTTLCVSHDVRDIIRGDGESRQSYIDRIMNDVKCYADDNPDKPVIIVSNWMPAAFATDPEGRPTRHDIDKVCADRPVVMRSFDYHAILVNTKALEMAGITDDTPDPRGGEFVKDEKGSLTGYINDITAIEEFLDRFDLADFSVEEYEEGILTFQNEVALPNGITSVFDAMVRPNAMKAYYNLAKAGKLKIHVSASWLSNPGRPESQFDEMIENIGKFDVGDVFHIKTVKFFMDHGAFGYYMNEPFEKEFLETNGMSEGYCGDVQWTSEELNRIFLKLSKAGYQIHVHCMGDGAVRHTLDAFEYVESQGVKGNRNVITHIQNISDEDVERMARLNVIAAMQPSWGAIDIFCIFAMLPLFGHDRTYELYPCGRLHDAGIMVTASTDYPIVASLNPFIGIETAITRTTLKSSDNYEQFKDCIAGLDDNPTRDCMSLEDIVRSYTENGAYQLFHENDYGKIQEGMDADILILGSVLENMDVLDIENTQIKTLIVGGEKIYG